MTYWALLLAGILPNAMIAAIPLDLLATEHRSRVTRRSPVHQIPQQFLHARFLALVLFLANRPSLLS